MILNETLQVQSWNHWMELHSGMAFEERVTVEVKADGMIEVFSAVNQMGQGIATTLAQLVVDVFGVPMEQVRVLRDERDGASQALLRDFTNILAVDANRAFVHVVHAHE